MKHKKLTIQSAEDSGYVVLNFEKILFAGTLEECLSYIEGVMSRD